MRCSARIAAAFIAHSFTSRLPCYVFYICLLSWAINYSFTSIVLHLLHRTAVDSDVVDVIACKALRQTNLGLQLTNYTDNDTKLKKYTTIMAISGDCQIRLASDAVVDQSDEMQLRPSAGDERPDIIHTVNKYKYKCISYEKKACQQRREKCKT